MKILQLPYLITILFVVVIFALAVGCQHADTVSCETDWTAIHGSQGTTCVAPTQSWDQGNLKKNDVAKCPNADFIAPNGKLVQCP
jgi:hypothetical protein